MIFVCDSDNTHHFQLHPHSPGLYLYDQVESKCGIPKRLQLLLHGGKTIEHAIPLSLQSISHGSTVYLLIKGLGGGGGNNSSSTQELLGNLSLCLSVCLSLSLSLSEPVS